MMKGSKLLIFKILYFFRELNKFFKKIRRYTITSFLVILIASTLVFTSFSVILPWLYFTGERDGQVNLRYDEIGKFYDDIELKVNKFRKASAEGGSYEQWVKPEEAIFIEIYPDDISRINEQNSSLRISGTINAYWHPEKSIKTIYENDDPLTKDFREDVLKNSYLNFVSTEEQLFEKIVSYELIDGSKKVIYRFEGEFPLLRNLSKFPFDDATWEIRLIFDISAAAMELGGAAPTIIYPTSNINAYEIVDISCGKSDSDKSEKYWACNSTALMSRNQFPPDSYSDPDNEDYVYASLDYGISKVLQGKLQRSLISSFARYLVPIIFGLLVLSMTDQLSSKEAWEIRVATPPTVLLTLIFMQNSYHNQLPQIAYLTWLDQIYLISYIGAILMLFNAVINKGDWFNKKVIDKFTRLKLTYFIRSAFTYLVVIGPILCFYVKN